MLPENSLIQPPIWSLYLSPDDLDVTFITDYSLGGIGLSDPSEGLEVQIWNMWVTDPGLTTSTVWVSSPNTPPTQLFSRTGITWARFTFDQNMHPTVCFIDNTGSWFYWWDPLIPGVAFTQQPVGVTRVSCSLDDKRSLETRLGTSDIIMAFILDDNLCYTQERDRYGTIYTLLTNISDLIVNPFVNKVGMNNSYRLQFQVAGQIYQ